MSAPVGPERIFALEAAEYVNHLDALLNDARESTPDGVSLARSARALRGCATMYRQADIARVASALERAATSLRDGSVGWDAALAGAMVGAVDDVRLLLRALPASGSDAASRAAMRTAELERLVPRPDAGVSPRAPVVRSTAATSFVVSGTTALAAALEHAASSPDDSAALGDALRQVRAVRGISSVGDLPPLGEVADVVERALSGATQAGPGGGGRLVPLLRAAAGTLRRASSELAAGERPQPFSPEMQRFSAAATAFSDGRTDADRIVPISDLYHGDSGPHIVSRAEHPPTTAGERFRLEVVSQAEHLRRIIIEARGTADADALGRLWREIRLALRALSALARSFGEDGVARSLALWSERPVEHDAAALEALHQAAELLADTHSARDGLARRLEALASTPAPASAPATTSREASHASGPTAPGAAQSRPSGAAPPSAATSTELPRRRPAPTPTGQELRALLESGIAGISRLDDQPLASPLPLPDEEIVPIETLLFRGRAALERARVVGAELRRAPAAPDPDSLAELYDLLELAAAE